MKAQLNPFSTFAALRAAQKQVIIYIAYRFPNLSTAQIEDLVSEAFFVTHTFQQADRLTVAPLSFAKTVARNKATDKTRAQKTRLQHGISFVNEAQATELPIYTEGGVWSGEKDKNMEILIDKTTQFIKKQKPETRQIFEALGDSQLSLLTDIELAEHFNFKVKTSSAVRKKRCDLKRKLTEHLAHTPQYQHIMSRLNVPT